VAVFCAHTNDQRVIENIESVISSYMRVETISLRFPNTDELLGLIEENYFKKYHFYLAADAKALLEDSINEIIDGKYFNGFKTIIQMANDIVYSLLESQLNNYEISAGLLGKFNKTSVYVKRIKTSVGKAGIGFHSMEEKLK
jgi:uncharacterized protein YjaG (DUF416 family)